MTFVLVLVGLLVAIGTDLFNRSRAYDHGPVGQFAGFLRTVGVICGPVLAVTAISA